VEGAASNDRPYSDPEVHGLARSAVGRVWVGDAATDEVLVVER
jgi:hypothetical protein